MFIRRGREAGRGIGADGDNLVAVRGKLGFEFGEFAELEGAEGTPAAAVENEDSGFFRKGGAEIEGGAVGVEQGGAGRGGADGERFGFGGGGRDGGAGRWGEKRGQS